MTDPRHARILANIAAEVARQYTKGQGFVTSNPEEGNVPIPHDCDGACAANDHGLGAGWDESWNYTLPEEYQVMMLYRNKYGNIGTLGHIEEWHTVGDSGGEECDWDRYCDLLPEGQRGK